MPLNFKLDKAFVARKAKTTRGHLCPFTGMAQQQPRSWFAKHAEAILVCCLVFSLIYILAPTNG